MEGLHLSSVRLDVVFDSDLGFPFEVANDLEFFLKNHAEINTVTVTGRRSFYEDDSDSYMWIDDDLVPALSLKELVLDHEKVAPMFFDHMRPYDWSRLEVINISTGGPEFFENLNPELFPNLRVLLTVGYAMRSHFHASIATFDSLQASFIAGLPKIEMLQILVGSPPAYTNALALKGDSLWSLDMKKLYTCGCIHAPAYFQVQDLELLSTKLVRLTDLTIATVPTDDGSKYSAWFQQLGRFRNLRRLLLSGDPDLIATLNATDQLPTTNALIGPYVRQLRHHLIQNKQGIPLELLLYEHYDEDLSGRIHRRVPERISGFPKKWKHRHPTPVLPWTRVPPSE